MKEKYSFGKELMSMVVADSMLRQVSVDIGF
jgi:hypothetical protein